MNKYKHKRHKYLLSCILSSVAGLLGIVDPILTSLLVSRVFVQKDLSRAGPVLVAFVTVKAVRIWARMIIAKLLGGNQRAPIIWLQRRIGRLIWWLEPLLHNWGWAGMVTNKLFGSTGPSAQIASGVSYAITDLAASFVAGLIYYFTQNYVLSFLSVLVLPALIVIPWATEKTRRGRPERKTEI